MCCCLYVLLSLCKIPSYRSIGEASLAQFYDLHIFILWLAVSWSHKLNTRVSLKFRFFRVDALGCFLPGHFISRLIFYRLFISCRLSQLLCSQLKLFDHNHHCARPSLFINARRGDRVSRMESEGQCVCVTDNKDVTTILIKPLIQYA